MMISVLMSVYKGDDPVFFRKALDSIVGQTVSAEEVVLVVDGPIGMELEDVISSFDGSLNIVLVRLEDNVGLGCALNTGLAHCISPLVARMDADDICVLDRFEKQRNVLNERQELDVIGSYAFEIDADDNAGTLRKMPVYHDGIMEAIWACPFLHPTVMYRRDRIAAVGGYNSSLRRRQDYELWFRCAKAGLKFHNIPEPLLLYRFNSYAHKKQSPRLALEQGVIGFKGVRNLNMSVGKALLCFIPFVRSWLPLNVQHGIYNLMRKFDPRQL